MPIKWRDSPAGYLETILEEILKDLTQDPLTLLRLIGETNEAIMVIMDLTEQRVVYRNRTLADELNLELSPPGPQALIPHMHPEDREKFIQHKKYLNASEGQLLTSQFRIKNSEGDYQLFELRERVFTSNGRKFTLGFSQNITQRVQSELEISALRRKLTAIYSTSPAIITLIDVQKGIVDFSTRSLGEELGYPKDALNKISELGSIVHPADVDKNRSQLAGLASNGVTDVFEIEFRLKDAKGVYHWFYLARQVIEHAPDGTPLRGVGTIMNIDLLKRTEASLRETLAISAARGVALARSNRELEQFAYVASHDLQEPLRIVVQYLGLLKQRTASEMDQKGKEYLQSAQDSALRMKGLIEGLLELSRMTTQQLRVDTFDGGEIFEQVLQFAAMKIKESKANVTVGSMPQIQGDSILLAQCFQNLISNAIKFRDAGRIPEISIACRETEDSLVFKVEDNGIGIDEKYIDKVFLVYKRLHSRQEYPGHGIGLSLCSRIVERHGGTIRIESKLGVGTTVVVTLPKIIQAPEME